MAVAMTTTMRIFSLPKATVVQTKSTGARDTLLPAGLPMGTILRAKMMTMVKVFSVIDVPTGIAQRDVVAAVIVANERNSMRSNFRDSLRLRLFTHHGLTQSLNQ